MKKRFLTLIILVIILIVIGLFYFSSRNTISNNPISSQNENPISNYLTNFRERALEGVATIVKKENSRLYQPVDFPVSAFNFSPDSSQLLIIHKLTGNIYAFDLKTKTLVRRSTDIINEIDRSKISLMGDNIVYYISNKKFNFLSYLDPQSTPTSSADLVFNDPDVYDVDFSNGITILKKQGDRSAVYSIKNLNSNQPTDLITTSSYSSGLIQKTENGLFIKTKASSRLLGFVFNLKGDHLSKLISGYGLDFIASPDGQKAIYSHIISGGVIETRLLDLKSTNDIPLKLKTLVDKCNWSKDSKTIYCGASNQFPTATYPDDWYQGRTNLTDNLWSIDPESGAITPEFNLIKNGQNLDTTDMNLSPNEEYLGFIDKKTNRLWLYDIFNYDTTK